VRPALLRSHQSSKSSIAFAVIENARTRVQPLHYLVLELPCSLSAVGEVAFGSGSTSKIRISSFDSNHRMCVNLERFNQLRVRLGCFAFITTDVDCPGFQFIMGRHRPDTANAIRSSTISRRRGAVYALGKGGKAFGRPSSESLQGNRRRLELGLSTQKVSALCCPMGCAAPGGRVFSQLLARLLRSGEIGSRTKHSHDNKTQPKALLGWRSKNVRTSKPKSA